MADEWVLVVPDDTYFEDIPNAGAERSREQVADEMERALNIFASRSLPSSAPRRLLPGVGALLAPAGTIPWTDPSVQVFPNVRRALHIPDRDGTLPGIPEPDTKHLVDTGVIDFRRCRGVSGAGVTIGVIDSGCAIHRDLDGKFADFVTVDDNGVLARTAPFDDHGHGTFVCGLIAGTQTGAAPDARLAVANVAQNRLLEMFPCEFASALHWLVLGRDEKLPRSSFRGADIINLSVGHDQQVPEYLPLVERARLKYGVALIAAIGNEGRRGDGRDDCPAHLDPVIGVGASDVDNNVWVGTGFRTVSNGVATAPKPDICAPGQSVSSCDVGGQYAFDTGTSFACGIVCGIAALLIQDDGRLRKNPDALEKRLFGFKRSAVGTRSRRSRNGIVMLTCPKDSAATGTA